MKKVILLLLFTTIVFGQKNAINKIDSVAYYIKLADFYKQKNNYKLSLSNANNALEFASKNKDTKNKALAYISLGTSYFDLKKINDAITAFSKSIKELSTLPISSDLALSYYKLGMCHMSLEEYVRAEAYINKSQEIYSALKIENQELMRRKYIILLVLCFFV